MLLDERTRDASRREEPVTDSTHGQDIGGEAPDSPEPTPTDAFPMPSRPRNGAVTASGRRRWGWAPASREPLRRCPGRALSRSRVPLVEKHHGFSRREASCQRQARAGGVKPFDVRSLISPVHGYGRCECVARDATVEVLMIGWVLGIVLVGSLVAAADV